MTFDMKSTQTEIFRSGSEKWIGGVCGGIAQITGWDVALVRALVVGGGFVSFGAVVLLYLAAWMLVPER
ncbi:PspC domain-containing protein [Actinomycetes bacterium M1A6_2h]